MDVERLMKDLTVEQLENIQASLQSEMESKKEELREMVGRRYRDVLDASAEVREVQMKAEQLENAVAKARHTAPTEPASRSADKPDAVNALLAIQALLPTIGSDEGDALSDSLAVLAVESLHKQLSSQHVSPSMAAVVRGLTTRVLRARKTLLDDLHNELSSLGRADWAAVQLSAVALLAGQPQPVQQLLACYLDARKDHIACMLTDSCSLLQLVCAVKETLQVVDELFVGGELQRVLMSVCGGGGGGASGTAANVWMPPLLASVCSDRAFGVCGRVREECARIGKQWRERRAGGERTLTTQQVTDEVDKWIRGICALAAHSVQQICDFYQQPDEIIEFLRALGIVFKEDWPRIGSNSSIYSRLFGCAVLDRFKAVLGGSLLALEKTYVDRVSQMDTAPPPLLDSRPRAGDQLLAVGIGSALHTETCALLSGVTGVREQCTRYDRVCMDSGVESVRECVAEGVVSMVRRVVEGVECRLDRARVALALLHADPASMCAALKPNKDGARVTTVATFLHTAVNDSIRGVVVSCVDECFSPVSLSDYLSAVDASGAAAGEETPAGLAIATEWELVDLPDVGAVSVPCVLSAGPAAALDAVCQKAADNAVAHLMAKDMRAKVGSHCASQLSRLLLPLLEKRSHEGRRMAQRTALQLLFDCRFVEQLVGGAGEELRACIRVLEQWIDPFDLTLLSPLIAKTVRTAVKRSQFVYGVVCSAGVAASKEATAPVKQHDPVPRGSLPARIPLIPRLDRASTVEGVRRAAASKTPKNKLLANPQGIKNTPSLSSFVDKVGSWWGGEG